MKPLFRWICGSVTQQGLDILEESVFRTMRALGDGWDWAICHNGLDHRQEDFLRSIVQGKPISIHQQSWGDCPIDDRAASPIRPDGTIEVDGGVCGGTLWKVCPPRMRIDAHEVIMDNDLVLLKKPPQVDDFLRSNKTLILEEPICFYGRYANLIPFEDRLNSGLMGLPPGFDFGSKIRRTWEDHGKYTDITQADEQGLFMHILQSHPNLRIRKEEVRELAAGDPPRQFGEEYGYHFVQSNRTFSHRSWLRYKQIFKESIPFL